MSGVHPGDLLAGFLERSEHSGQRARLAALTAAQSEGLTAIGRHCGFPRCAEPARYLSSLRSARRNGTQQQRGRLLCDGHAARFAARHDIDMTAVPAPEGEDR